MKRHVFISILVLGRIFDRKYCRFTFEVKITFILGIAHIPLLGEGTRNIDVPKFVKF